MMGRAVKLKLYREELGLNMEIVENMDQQAHLIGVESVDH